VAFFFDDLFNFIEPSLGTAVDTVGGLLQAGSTLTGLVQSNAAIGNIEDRAAGQLDVTAEQAALADALAGASAELTRRLAEQGADLLLGDTADASQLSTASAAAADRLAAFEERAGAIAHAEAERRGQRNLSALRARLAASGTRLAGSNVALLEQQASEVADDLLALETRTAANARRARDQAGLFRLRDRLSLASAQRRAEAIRRTGDLRAEQGLLAGQTRNESAQIQSQFAAQSLLDSSATARVGLLGDIFESGLNLLQPRLPF